jgi:hypothetical protein
MAGSGRPLEARGGVECCQRMRLPCLGTTGLRRRETDKRMGLGAGWVWWRSLHLWLVVRGALAEEVGKQGTMVWQTLKRLEDRGSWR